MYFKDDKANAVAIGVLGGEGGVGFINIYKVFSTENN